MVAGDLPFALVCCSKLQIAIAPSLLTFTHTHLRVNGTLVNQGQKRYPKELLRQRFRVNFLVRFASKPLFYWVMTGNPLELFKKLFGAVRAMFMSLKQWPPRKAPFDLSGALLPKGPFRTKNALAPTTVVFYYCRSI